MVQSVAPRVLGRSGVGAGGRAARAEVGAARTWALLLAGVSSAVAIAVTLGGRTATTVAVIGGLIVFGLVFAVNSSLHSYLILAYSERDDVSIDVGFYYSANATGRLVGTLLSGVLYLAGGLEAALWGSTGFVVAAWLLSLRLPVLPAVGEAQARPGVVDGADLDVDDSGGQAEIPDDVLGQVGRDA
jgi:predicted MFS family arabinose efflux permease